MSRPQPICLDQAQQIIDELMVVVEHLTGTAPTERITFERQDGHTHPLSEAEAG